MRPALRLFCLCMISVLLLSSSLSFACEKKCKPACEEGRKCLDGACLTRDQYYTNVNTSVFEPKNAAAAFFLEFFIHGGLGHYFYSENYYWGAAGTVSLTVGFIGFLMAGGAMSRDLADGLGGLNNALSQMSGEEKKEIDKCTNCDEVAQAGAIMMGIGLVGRLTCSIAAPIITVENNKRKAARLVEEYEQWKRDNNLARHEIYLDAVYGGNIEAAFDEKENHVAQVGVFRLIDLRF